MKTVGLVRKSRFCILCKLAQNLSRRSLMVQITKLFCWTQGIRKKMCLVCQKSGEGVKGPNALCCVIAPPLGRLGSCRAPEQREGLLPIDQVSCLQDLRFGLGDSFYRRKRIIIIRRRRRRRRKTLTKTKGSYALACLDPKYSRKRQ